LQCITADRTSRLEKISFADSWQLENTPSPVRSQTASSADVETVYVREKERERERDRQTDRQTQTTGVEYSNTVS